MDELSTWFGPLNARLGAEAEQGLEPAPNEVGLLLEMGKLAAEAGPQRFYALLTGFAVGRALGRAERDDATLDTRAFLQKALEDVQAVAASVTLLVERGRDPLRSLLWGHPGDPGTARGEAHGPRAR